MPQGVSGTIKRRGGYQPFWESAKHGPISLGGAVHTSAGKLSFKEIIHVAGINMLWFATEKSIRKSVRSFSGIVPTEYRSMRFADGIEENWCGGVFIPPEAVSDLLRDIENDPGIRIAILKTFGSDDELERFFDLLRYSEENGFGLLEATEVVFPFAGACMSDVSHCEPGFMDRIRISPFLTTPHCFSTEASIPNGKYCLDEEQNLHENEKNDGIEKSFDPNIREIIIEQIRKIKTYGRKRLVSELKAVPGEILEHRILPTKIDFLPCYIGSGVLGIMSLVASFYIPPLGNGPLPLFAPWIFWGFGLVLLGAFVLMTIVIVAFQ